MFRYHKIIKENDKVVLCLYLDKNDTEFSMDFMSLYKNSRQKIEESVKSFIQNHHIDFKGSVVKIFVGSLLVSTLMFGNPVKASQFETVSPTYKVEVGDSLWSIANENQTSVDNLKNFNDLQSDMLYPGDILKLEENTFYKVKSGDTLWALSKKFNTSVSTLKQTNNLTSDYLFVGQRLVIDNISVYNVKAGDSLWKIATLHNMKVDQLKQLNELNTDNIYIGQELVLLNTQQNIESNMTIKLKQANGVIIDISLDDYVVGVVSSEMDPSFNEEALKAQALAARTYAIQVHERNEVLLTTDYHQVYKNETELRALWGNYYDSFNQKVKKVVSETSGEVIKYQGDYIEAYYFSTSNGKTENPSFIWGGEVEYLKSVDSSYDKNSREFYSTKTMSLSQFTNSLGLRTSFPSINVISYTTGERVDLIEIGGITFKGTTVRSKLNLRSTDFTIEIKNNTVTINQKGFGHGVGMSQYGAHFMGLDGYSYKDIIHHYYYDVDIVKI